MTIHLTDMHALWEVLQTQKYDGVQSVPAPDLYKDFVKVIESIGRRHSLSTVFNDFLTVSICSFHETNIMTRLAVKDEANEELYMTTIAKYKKDELTDLTKLLGIFQANAYNNPYSDLLGTYFTEHITQGHNGQFFTPDAVCKMMAQLQGEPGTIGGKNVADHTCGSGRLLLAFAEINPNNKFYGADNNNTCAKMSTLNFFISGLQGEVAWMNTLTMEWYGGWQVNRWPSVGIVPIEKEHSRLWAEPPKAKNPLKNIDDLEFGGQDDGQQLTLF